MGKNIGIKIEHISKSFAGEQILEDINMEIEEGSIVGVMGENGSGKSVLFKLICGLMLPDCGEIRVFNKKISKGDFPENIGVLLDKTGFIPSASGYDNLKSIAVIKNTADRKRIEEVMELVGLDAGNRKPVKKYSLGMKQRLGIAMAMMENPRLMLLDEPMNSLDKQMVGKVRNIILEMNRKNGTTILLVSHNEADIKELCNMTYRIEDRKICRVS